MLCLFLIVIADLCRGAVLSGRAGGTVVVCICVLIGRWSVVVVCHEDIVIVVDVHSRGGRPPGNNGQRLGFGLDSIGRRGRHGVLTVNGEPVRTRTRRSVLTSQSYQRKGNFGLSPRPGCGCTFAEWVRRAGRILAERRPIPRKKLPSDDRPGHHHQHRLPVTITTAQTDAKVID